MFSADCGCELKKSGHLNFSFVVFEVSRGCARVLVDFGLVLCEVLKKKIIFLIFFSFCLLRLL